MHHRALEGVAALMINIVDAVRRIRAGATDAADHPGRTTEEAESVV